MKAIVFAYHDMGCIGMEGLLAAGVSIEAIFTHRDNPQEQQFFRSVAECAAEHNLTIFSPETINTPYWTDRIAAWDPDYLFSFYYRQKIPKAILKLAKKGAYNLHGSLLPRYRGCAPLNWVLIQGETETGVTLHEMTPQLDAGGIIAQQRIAIHPEDDAPRLHKKLCDTATDLLRKTLPSLLNNRCYAQPQDESQATYFGRRTPTDGEISWSLASDPIHNLVRALTRPYPGAYSFFNGERIRFWKTESLPLHHDQPPGTVLTTSPFCIAAGKGAVGILAGQVENGIYLSGLQLATELGIIAGNVLGAPTAPPTVQSPAMTKVLILGVNGFIGSHIAERLLQEPNYEIYGFDRDAHHLDTLKSHPRFHFREGDIRTDAQWIIRHIQQADVLLPLIAIATPIEYVRNPLKIFELDFEENIKLVRHCVVSKTRIVFPSTSEVYGMCSDAEFDEMQSQLVVGPVTCPRWIYSVSKQLLDRVICAYGNSDSLPFTLFRPFNWTGPRLDSLAGAKTGNARVLTQMIYTVTQGLPISLVNGGKQRRAFTDIDDATEALFRIIRNQDGCCDQQILNIGAPNSVLSIAELASLLRDLFEEHPLKGHFPAYAGTVSVSHETFYGKGYQDIAYRCPSIARAQTLLQWSPTTPITETIKKTLDFLLPQAMAIGVS